VIPWTIPHSARIDLTQTLAADKCAREERKTVNGENILFAWMSLGFENHAEAMEIYLARYREQLLTVNLDQSNPLPMIKVN